MYSARHLCAQRHALSLYFIDAAGQSLAAARHPILGLGEQAVMQLALDLEREGDGRSAASVHHFGTGAPRTSCMHCSCVTFRHSQHIAFSWLRRSELSSVGIARRNCWDCNALVYATARVINSVHCTSGTLERQEEGRLMQQCSQDSRCLEIL